MKYVSLKFELPANECKMGGQINSILGQHQINIMEFIQEFNYKTENLLSGIPVRVKVKKNLNDNSRQLIILGPSFSFLLEKYVKNKSIKITDLYDIICIFVEFYKEKEVFQVVLEIFGYLRSKDIIIVL